MTKRKDLSNLPSVWCAQGSHYVKPVELVWIKSSTGKNTRVLCKDCNKKRKRSHGYSNRA